nr:unnamed protein product [Digitaria exilis]
MSTAMGSGAACLSSMRNAGGGGSFPHAAAAAAGETDSGHGMQLYEHDGHESCSCLAGELMVHHIMPR